MSIFKLNTQNSKIERYLDLQAIFAGLMVVTDAHIDRPRYTYTVCSKKSIQLKILWRFSAIWPSFSQ